MTSDEHDAFTLLKAEMVDLHEHMRKLDRRVDELTKTTRDQSDRLRVVADCTHLGRRATALAEDIARGRPWASAEVEASAIIKHAYLCHSSIQACADEDARKAKLAGADYDSFDLSDEGAE